uniref:Tc1-like transposase DDE domain-containing protein n=1 Tax=Panagrolaimus superbus TaxID=310955 RepID=A0A914XZF4_9BILA
MISERNTHLRILYREHIMVTNQFFYNHLFVDECKITSGHHGKFQWYRVNQFNPKRKRVAHYSGFSIYGGISRRGPTSFLIIPGNARINSEIYCDMIGHCVYPFIRDVYAMNCNLIQDNASIHVSHYTREFMDHLGIRRSFFPAQSPDFNPIEYVWRGMKEYVSQKNPTDLEQLQLRIAEYVRKYVTVEFCNQLIDYSRRNIIRSVDGRNYEGTKPTNLLYRDIR